MRPSSKQKRDAVLKSAERQFLESGYEAVTMESIAADSTVAKQTLYSYFGTKRELFLELVSTRTMAATASVRTETPTLHPNSSPRTVLHELLCSQLKTVLSPTLLGLRRLVIGEVRRSPELAAALYEHGPSRAISKIAEILSDFSERGALQVSDTELAATQLNWLVMGEPINRAMHLGDEAAQMTATEIDKHVTAALATFFDGVG